jgi:uncharacterized protein (DUF3084 family)
MSNDDRIVELLTGLVRKVDHLDAHVTQLDVHVAELGANQRETNERLERVEQRLERLERLQERTNLILQDHTLAIMKLADKIEEFSDVGKRLSRLEEAVFH